MNPQATIRLKEGTPLFHALFKSAKKIDDKESIELNFDGNRVIYTPLELGGEIIAELEIHSDGFDKEQWITLFLG